MVKVTIKHSAINYEVEVDPASSAADFKAVVYSVSGVPPDRQKLMSKAWKGLLKDDAPLTAVTEGLQVTLMGTAEVLAKPVEKTVFVEDLPASAQALAGMTTPSGIQNFENICYANSCLEALRFVPELREGLKEFHKENDAKFAAAITAAAMRSGISNAAEAAQLVPPGFEGRPYAAVDLSLARLYDQLDSTPKAVNPKGFFTILRGAYPRFAESAGPGMYKQQDSDEFYGAILNALAGELQKPTGSMPKLAASGDSSTPANLIDTLFGLDFEVTMKCKETDAEPAVVKKEHHRKLVCNIEGGAGKSVQVNHLHEGVQLWMNGDLEKRSEVLGRNAVWSKSLRVSQLPRYICVQFLRFFWKQGAEGEGVSCKMLRPVTFPAELDVFDLCTEGVRSVLKQGRDKHSAAVTAGIKKPAVLGGGAAGGAAAAGGAGAASSEDSGMAIEGAAAGGAGAAAGGVESIGHGLPEDFRGLYEICSVVTHKGRSSDSGHYMGWVRQKGDDWLVFDDDEVSETTTEYVLSHLKGGGDDHMAYLVLYRAKA